MKKIYQIIILCAMSIAIASCGNSTPSWNNYKGDYRTAVQNGDYEAAHKIIKQLGMDFEEERAEQLAKGKEFLEDERMSVESKAQTYFEAIKDIYCSEVMYLMSDNNSEVDTKIIFILNELPNLGIKYQEGKELYFIDGNAESQRECLNYFLYSESVRCNNTVCDKILSIAIAMKNDKMAKLALSQFKDECMTDEESCVRYNSNTKDEAQRKYHEAVQNGVFD
ncbi:hypothetical protein [Prevotellamassilia timonensis]|uniref:hypothetical protein n=1 Tax=Prevotellamassilia timonensis TaxID=1852370 RepID=UPI001F211BB1|nr:hypothetical protein [Prevotellamassilia timonensis]MCF2634619.1 hypothetical protein [Prevotellamassilia timonensis]